MIRSEGSSGFGKGEGVSKRENKAHGILKEIKILVSDFNIPSRNLVNEVVLEFGCKNTIIMHLLSKRYLFLNPWNLFA